LQKEEEEEEVCILFDASQLLLVDMQLSPVLLL
jgi:hypothetical protein